MTQTTKYKLPQWEKADRIVMEDFNGMAAKLETALTAHDTAIAGLNSGKADKTTTNSLQTQVNQKATTTAFNSAVSDLQSQLNGKIVCGTYTGDGTETRTISLGFTPQVVLLTTYDGKMGLGNGINGGLAIAGGTSSGIAIVTGGFEVHQNSLISTNTQSQRYNYFAVR